VNRRALVEHLLRRRELILTKVASSGERFSALKNLERAEKRFLLAFVTSIAGGSYWLSTELWGLNVGNLLTLPIYQVTAIILGLTVTLASALAVLSYLSIGVVVQRAVEIRPRESD
jgi:hypothetical protein